MLVRADPVLCCESSKGIQEGEPNSNALKTLDCKEATRVKPFVFRFEPDGRHGTSRLHIQVHEFRVADDSAGVPLGQFNSTETVIQAQVTPWQAQTEPPQSVGGSDQGDEARRGASRGSTWNEEVPTASMFSGRNAERPRAPGRRKGLAAGAQESRSRLDHRRRSRSLSTRPMMDW